MPEVRPDRHSPLLSPTVQPRPTTRPVYAPWQMPRVFRAFPDAVEAASRQWREEVLTTLAWVIVGRPGEWGGEAQSFFVRSGEIGGYAKPGHDQPSVAQHPRAGHEKIAADLAFELGLPVPPAVLWDRGNVAAPQERYLAISHLAFTPTFTWAQVQTHRVLVQRLAAAISEAASAMAAFDTWVGNTDRVNAANVLVQLDDRQNPPIARVAYIDYANSLSYGWRAGGAAWMQGPAVGCYPQEVVPNLAAMAEGVGRIEALSPAVIEGVVGRIPPGFLTDECRQVILGGLSYRKGTLRETMRVRYPGLM